MRKLLLLAVALCFVARPLAAQSSRVGVIDFYGLRTLKPPQLAAALATQIGDSLRDSKALRLRLLSVPGVADAQVSAVCCEAGRAILYVGVREAGTPELSFRAAPHGEVRLPADVVVVGENFRRAFEQGVATGNNAEDDSAGYSVVLYAPARMQQQKLITYAQDHVELLRDVVRNSADGAHRALAAQMIAYTPDRTAAVDELLNATQDPDPDVRNNAMRALAIMAMYKQSHPNAPYDVPFTPFIKYLNSLDWTDRNKASFALVALTESRNPQLLAMLRDSAFDSLTEMARWKVVGHAAAPAVILGRIAGLSDKEISDKIMRDRDSLIRAARGR